LAYFSGITFSLGIEVNRQMKWAVTMVVELLSSRPTIRTTFGQPRPVLQPKWISSHHRHIYPLTAYAFNSRAKDISQDRLGNSFDQKIETGENPSPDTAIQAKRAR
jgi:hypothetical protein